MGYETLASAIETRIKRYHEDFSLCLMAEQWEEVLKRAMEDVGLNPEWENDRSHKVGEDIFEKSIGRISCKSGSLGNGTVKFNGSRTTRFKTLKEKVEFLSSSHDDCYFMLAKDKKDIMGHHLKLHPNLNCQNPSKSPHPHLVLLTMSHEDCNKANSSNESNSV